MKLNFKTAAFAFAISMLVMPLAMGQLKEKYKAGYLQLRSGERVDGYIRSDEVQKMNYRVWFKRDLKQKAPTEYDTSKLTRVVFNDGETYERLTYKVHHFTDSLTGLARLMVRGKASLYLIFLNETPIYLVKNQRSIYALRENTRDGLGMETNYYYKDYLAKALADGNDTVKFRIRAASFNYNSILSAVSAYNTTTHSENTVFVRRPKRAGFVMLSMAVMKKKNDQEIHGQLYYRMYVPEFSKNTSFNIGVNYFSRKWTFQLLDSTLHVDRSFISFPLQLQQNIMSGWLRPYFFFGLNVGHVKEQIRNPSRTLKGTREKTGFGFLYGAGVEVDIVNGLYFKTEFRYENYRHMIMPGIGFYFSRM
jgi:hypothetical protein